MCKSYHSTGFCPYGTRCHFIHNAEDIEKDSSEEDSLDVKPFEGLKIRLVLTLFCVQLQEKTHSVNYETFSLCSHFTEKMFYYCLCRQFTEKNVL